MPEILSSRPSPASTRPPRQSPKQPHKTPPRHSFDCQKKGNTATNITIKKGYWRGTADSTFVRKCRNSWSTWEHACKGGEGEHGDGLCAEGYEGPLWCVL